MSLEKRIGLLESKITALDDERVTLIRELNTLKSEYQAQKLKQRPLLGRPSRVMPPNRLKRRFNSFLTYFEPAKTFIRGAGKTREIKRLDILQFV